jgi:hypothetical protein
LVSSGVDLTRFLLDAFIIDEDMAFASSLCNSLLEPSALSEMTSRIDTNLQEEEYINLRCKLGVER